jgi:hypothetical protein
MFASKTLTEHFVRGAGGMGALVGAAAVAPAHPLLALALVPLALVLLRGCPMCWTMGLVQTIAAKLPKRSAKLRWVRGGSLPGACLDGSCARKP